MADLYPFVYSGNRPLGSYVSGIYPIEISEALQSRCPAVTRVEFFKQSGFTNERLNLITRGAVVTNAVLEEKNNFAYFPTYLKANSPSVVFAEMNDRLTDTTHSLALRAGAGGVTRAQLKQSKIVVPDIDAFDLATSGPEIVDIHFSQTPEFVEQVSFTTAPYVGQVDFRIGLRNAFFDSDLSVLAPTLTNIDFQIGLRQTQVDEALRSQNPVISSVDFVTYMQQTDTEINLTSRPASVQTQFTTLFKFGYIQESFTSRPPNVTNIVFRDMFATGEILENLTTQNPSVSAIFKQNVLGYTQESLRSSGASLVSAQLDTHLTEGFDEFSLRAQNPSVSAVELVRQVKDGYILEQIKSGLPILTQVTMTSSVAIETLMFNTLVDDQMGMITLTLSEPLAD